VIPSIVKLVLKVTQDIVKIVFLQRSMLLNVNAHQVCTNSQMDLVDNVLTTVMNVIVKPLIVLIVGVTESTNQFVNVHQVLMKPMLKSVHLATNYVKNV
jgi:hypothetical protein